LLYELHSPEDEGITVLEILVAIYQVTRCNIPQDTMEWLRKKQGISQPVPERRNELRDLKSKKQG
jgi:hypothetical protein